MNSHRLVVPLLAAGSLIAGGAATPASADVDQGGSPAGIGIPHAVLGPVLHATLQSSDEGTYTFTAKCYFDVGSQMVARLPSFSGTATPTRKDFTLKVSAFERHEIDVAARRTHHKHVTLKIVTTVPTTIPPPAATTVTQEIFLVIPGA
ncbi:MAG TPA: hypothetical protein VG165_06130 [Solirubrobacteraceae bacterium]|jgi:hypothetical protein|nr:hypothetical protein [Solirubrobacteraceae bacterium]